MSARKALLILSLIVIAGVALRADRLSAPSIWFDEAFSWRLSQYPLAELVSRDAQDNNPPLYYLLLKAWIAVWGESTLALRSLSVSLSGLTIAAMYFFTCEALAFRPTSPEERTWAEAHATSRPATRHPPPSTHHGAALLVAALVATNVFQIRWAWEARMYSLGTLLMALSSWALFRALRPAESRWQDWACFGFLTLLFAYTHSFALLSITAQALFLAGFFYIRSGKSVSVMCRCRAFQHALLAGAILALGWLPWLPVFLKQRAQVQSSFWVNGLGNWTAPNIFYQMFAGPELISKTNAVIATLLCVLGFTLLLRKARAGEWYIAFAALLPFALCAVISKADTKIFTLRYFIFAGLFFLAALGVLVWRIRGPRQRWLAAAAVVAASFWAHVDYRGNLRVAERPGVQAATAYIDCQRRPGEPILVCHPFLYLPVRYHARERTACRMFNDGSPVVHWQGGAVTTPEDLATADDLRAIRADTVWVVNMQGGWWGRHAVPVPCHWVAKSETRFAELIGPAEVNVIAYSTGGHAPEVPIRTAGQPSPSSAAFR